MFGYQIRFFGALETCKLIKCTEFFWGLGLQIYQGQIQSSVFFEGENGSNWEVEDDADLDILSLMLVLCLWKLCDKDYNAGSGRFDIQSPLFFEWFKQIL